MGSKGSTLQQNNTSSTSSTTTTARVRTYSASAGAAGSSSSSSGTNPGGITEHESLHNQTTTSSTHRQRSASSSITPAEWLSSRITFSVAVKCPICSKQVNPDDVEVHLVMCLTRPRIHYNEDTLSSSLPRECSICLEDLSEGQAIARLPCLCIYHKTCIDSWWRVNRVCPEHPD